MITVPCDSSSQPSFKVFPTCSPKWNARVHKTDVRNNVDQIRAHSQWKRLEPSKQVMRDTVVSIPFDSVKPSARVPTGRPTWNVRVDPVGARNINVSQTRVRVEPNSFVATHEGASCDNRGGSCALWKRVAPAVFVVLILLLRKARHPALRLLQRSRLWGVAVGVTMGSIFLRIDC